MDGREDLGASVRGCQIGGRGGSGVSTSEAHDQHPRSIRAGDRRRRDDGDDALGLRLPSECPRPGHATLPGRPRSRQPFLVGTLVGTTPGALWTRCRPWPGRSAAPLAGPGHRLCVWRAPDRLPAGRRPPGVCSRPWCVAEGTCGGAQGIDCSESFGGRVDVAQGGRFGEDRPTQGCRELLDAEGLGQELPIWGQRRGAFGDEAAHHQDP